MTAAQRVSATELRAAFEIAQCWLELNREALNAINVYPVPDGDTGTNMVLTMRAALQAAPADPGGVGALCAAMAEGALLGARGNSGVILSQMLRGFADGLAGCAELRGGELSAALDRASRAAYEAVGSPVEGTMLTVLREAAAEAAEAHGRDPALPHVLAAAVAEAEASVERTPQLLPMLNEAGVVDAGGQGVAVLLGGLLLAVRGEPLPDAPPAPAGVVDLGGVEHEGHGYCVEYVLRGEALDREALAAALTAAEGDSLLVVGDATALHVHVHVGDPGPALSAGAALGALQAVLVQNMQAQHDRWAAGHQQAARAGAGELPAVGLVAVAQGAGLRAAFRELGASVVGDGAATGKPSAGELLEAARSAGRDHVFILPNDPDVLMAAEQAASREPGFITVVPTHSAAAGLAAAVCFVPDESPEALSGLLRDAAEAVRCVEVTRSVRDASIDGIRIAAGDAIAFVDGRLTTRADSLEEALLAGLAEVVDEASELVSLILGTDATPDSAERLPTLIEAAHPGVTVEVVRGEQPHYPYVAGIE